MENIDEFFQKIEENHYVSSYDIAKADKLSIKPLGHLHKIGYTKKFDLDPTFNAKKFNGPNLHL